MTLSFRYPINVSSPSALRIDGVLTDELRGPHYVIEVSVRVADWSVGVRPAGEEFRANFAIPAAHGINAVLYGTRELIRMVESGFIEERPEKQTEAKVER